MRNWDAVILDVLRLQKGFPGKVDTFMLRNGINIEIHNNDSVGFLNVFIDIVSKKVYNCFEEMQIHKDDIVVDIGANIGIFAIKAAIEAPEGKVYAFEPFSQHFDKLQANIFKNSIKNIRCFNTGISDRTERVLLYYNVSSGAPKDTSIYKMVSEPECSELVDLVSLEDFFQREGLQRCDFMKLDCEGAEYKILMETNRHVLDSIAKIAIEWHRFDSDHEPMRLANFLLGNGFKLIEPKSYETITGYLYAYR